MIVISSALALSAAYQLDAALPVIGWHNLATVTSLTADSEHANYPVGNLANTNTTLRWQSESTGDQYITVTLSTEEAVDYLAVARHNFGSTGIVLSVEGLSGEEEAEWEELVSETMPADDAPILFRFEASYLTAIRLKLQPDEVEPRAAVMYVGSLLVCQRGTQPGHTPLPYGKRRTIINNRSEDGEYLGTIQTGEGLESTVQFNYFDPAWYRENFQPFLDEAPPFFFAWHPQTYPDEVGFAWLREDAVPVPSHLAGYINVTLQMDGLAL